MSVLAAFTLFHVILSLIGILAGAVFVYGVIAAKSFPNWRAVFLWTTLLTSVTGFLFPFHKLLPSHILGILSLIALAAAYFALYVRRLASGWQLAFLLSALLALYFNVFVLVVQLFRKVPALNALAPTQTEAPFKIAQLALLCIFVALGTGGVWKSRAQHAGGL